MVWGLLYNFALLLCCGYAVWRGGRWERLGAYLIFVGSTVTTALVLWQGRVNSYQAFELEVFAIDVAVLAALVWLALISSRYWPLFVTGFHAAGTATHAAVLADVTFRPLAYAHALGLFAYLMLFALVIGTWREARAPESAATTSRPFLLRSAAKERETPPIG